MKRILLTGASGYVGSKVYLDLKEHFKDAQIIGTYFNNKFFDDLISLDLTSPEEVKSVINKYKPDIIIHNAANAKGSWNEVNPEEAKRINFDSTKNLVDAIKELGSKTKFIFISSFAAYNPNTVYGKLKLDSENIVKELEDNVILRPSLILGLSPNTENDRPFNALLKDITKNESSEYDTSWNFNLTYLGHLSEVITQVIDRNDIKDIILPVVSEGVTTRFEIAKNLFQKFGMEAKAIDKKSNIIDPVVDFSIYEKLKLRYYSLEEVLEEIYLEIKQYIELL